MFVEKFSVLEGVMKFVYPDGAFSANPTTPYGVYTFDNSKLPTWQLDEKEAIVFFGCTPPPARYFSYRSYLFSTFNRLQPTIVFASLGDSINNLVVNSSDQMGTDPFGKTTVVVSTADVSTDLSIRKIFSEVGISSTIINTDIIPSSLVKMGHNVLADRFNILHRAAIFEDARQGQAYFNTTWPVFRVTPPSQQNQPNPFATPELRKRGNGTSEIAFNSSLSSFLTKVDSTVKQTLSQFSAAIDRMSVVHLDGFECIETFRNCLGDNR